MSSAQQFKSDKTQFEGEGDADKWMKSVNESASSIESVQHKNEESSGFLQQMKQLANEAAIAMKNAVAKKNNKTEANAEEPIAINRCNDPSFHEYRP